jgi:hypothetical protein
MQVRVIPVFAVGLLLVAALAGAQPAASFEDLPLHLNLDDQIRVVSEDGRTIRGTLVALSPDALDVRADGNVHRFTPETTREVGVRGDSLANGAIIGLGAGAAYGGAFAYGFSDHPRASDVAQGALVFGAIGTALGVGVDALIRGHRVVYRRRAVAHVVPLMGPRGRHGAAVNIGW